MILLTVHKRKDIHVSHVMTDNIHIGCVNSSSTSPPVFISPTAKTSQLDTQPVTGNMLAQELASYSSLRGCDNPEAQTDDTLGHP